MSSVVEFSDRENLIDRRMTWTLRHGGGKNNWMLASALRAELIRTDRRGKVLPTVVEIVGIATLSTKRDKRKPDQPLIQRYKTKKDGDGIWIALSSKSEKSHEWRTAKRRRGDTVNHDAAEAESCDGSSD